MRPIEPDDRPPPAEEDPGGRVIPLRAPKASGDPSSGEVFDTHFEVALDDPGDEPEPGAGRAPVYVDVVSREHEYQPIIPASLRGWRNIRVTLKRFAGRTGRRLAKHTLWLVPVYLPLALFYAPIGAVRIVGRQLRWWWVSEATGLRQNAATRDDWQAWERLHRQIKATRAWRGIVLAAEAAGLTVAGLVLALAAPRWVGLLVLVVVLPWLAHVGRPVDRPIVTPAVVTPRFRKLTADIVLRAYYAARLGDPDKPGQQVQFGSVMSRDGEGSRVQVDLPYGKGFDDAVKARPAIASGLDVAVNQVYLTRDPASHRSHTLWVADRDPLAVAPPRTPLLDCRPRDIWQPVPFGLDERGQLVTISLMWISILVGAQPRKGKTFAVRLPALYAALDPWVKLFIADGKNSPDWRRFALVADAMIYGTHPTRDGDPVEQLLLTLRAFKKHIQRVNDILSHLPVDVCREGKLTRDLARDPRYPELRVWLLVMEEFQVYYELDDRDASNEIASLLSYVMAVGPSAGVIILSSTQKPSGIGAGQTLEKMFNRFRDNHTARFALKCGNRSVSEAILGSDAYAEGIDASALPPGPVFGHDAKGEPLRAGVGYLYGLTDRVPTVRTHIADHADAEKILQAARRHRQAAGTLSGMAAGEDVARQARDVLADVRSVFYAGEAWVSWRQLAARLAEQIPEHYADLTAEAISAQARALKVESKDGRDKSDGNRVVKGAHLASVEAAIKRKAITDV